MASRVGSGGDQSECGVFCLGQPSTETAKSPGSAGSTDTGSQGPASVSGGKHRAQSLCGSWNEMESGWNRCKERPGCFQEELECPPFPLSIRSHMAHGKERGHFLLSLFHFPAPHLYSYFVWLLYVVNKVNVLHIYPLRTRWPSISWLLARLLHLCN